MDAEKGKPSTTISVYAALLWVYDLLQLLSDIADPARDAEGLALVATKEKTRVRKSTGLASDF
jgi:hypothetical protein